MRLCDIDNMLTLKNLSVKYQSSPNWNLININLQGDKGELIIIAGRSGSGKSTLAQAIIGIIPAFSNAEITGSILINGHELRNLTRSNLINNFGYLPQYPSDFTISLLVEEEIVFPLENLQLPIHTIQRRLKALLEELGIKHLQHRVLTELSSGELQKVALATAIIHQPSIIILDEPMARIDPKTEIQLLKILERLQKSGHLILIFEHRLDYLLTIANRLIVLENGSILADDSPKNIIKKLSGIDMPEISQIDTSLINPPVFDLKEATNQMMIYLSSKS